LNTDTRFRRRKIGTTKTATNISPNTVVIFDMIYSQSVSNALAGTAR